MTQPKTKIRWTKQEIYNSVGDGIIGKNKIIDWNNKFLDADEAEKDLKLANQCYKFGNYKITNGICNNEQCKNQLFMLNKKRLGFK